MKNLIKTYSGVAWSHERSKEASNHISQTSMRSDQIALEEDGKIH